MREVMSKDQSRLPELHRKYYAFIRRLVWKLAFHDLSPEQSFLQPQIKIRLEHIFLNGEIGPEEWVHQFCLS